MKIRLTKLVTACLCLSVTAAYSQTPTPYSTAITNYVYMGSPGLNNSTSPQQIFTTAGPAAPAFTNGVTVTGASTKINGIGLNQQDGFLYGIAFPSVAATSSALLYRLGSNGVALSVGNIPAPVVAGATLSYINTTAGFIDGSGNYWFSAYVYTGNPLITPYNASNLQFYFGKVSGVGTLTASSSGLAPTYYQVGYQADTAFRKGVQSFLNNFNYVNPGSSNGGFEDIALNPVDGKFYTYYSYPDPANTSQLLHRPAVIDPLTWKASTVGTVANTAPNREIAGAYFDPSGNFYVLFTNAQYSQVNLTTGALTGLIATGLPVSNGSNLRGDLASNIAATPLPVRLVSFTGQAQGGSNILSWTTGAESNAGSFVIERSSSDGRFTEVGSVAPKGSGSNYFFEDRFEGLAFYRLRLADEDGSIAYSLTIRLQSAVSDVAAPIVYPTLIRANSFMVKASGEFTVRVTDNSGALVVVQPGSGSAEIPLEQPGVYTVQISSGDGAATITRVVKY